MRWLELSVEADAEAVEAVSEILGRVATGTAVHPTALLRDPTDELAAEADANAPFRVVAHVADDKAAAAAVDRTERALWHLQAFGLRAVGSLRVRPVDDAAWTEAWREHYAPQRIGRVVIVPSWVEEPMQPGELAITLDPGMAFGTGIHPTTRACLALLQELPSVAGQVLDVGSGSGILGLAALRLGAAHVTALDTDPLAVDATRRNAERNGLADRVTAAEGSLPDEAAATYPLVLANLVASVLVKLAPRLAAHAARGGTLLASGIIEPRAEEVVRALERAGLALAERRTDGDWVSLRLVRRA